MQDPKGMEKQMILISETMQQVEELVRSKIKTHEDFMSVCSALMAVTRNMYVEGLGPQATVQMFEAAADSIMVTEELLSEFGDYAKPTIH